MINKARDNFLMIEQAVDTGLVLSPTFNNKKSQVFGLLGKSHPAYSFNYKITLQKEFNEPDTTLNVGTPSNSVIFLLGCTDFNHPPGGVVFQNVADNGYQVTAQLETLDNVVFTYWDRADWLITQRLNAEIYKTQFAESGLLVQNYASSICTVEHGPLTRTYYECAISKPVPLGGSAENGLLKFRFSLAYNRKEEKYNKVLV